MRKRTAAILTMMALGWSIVGAPTASSHETVRRVEGNVLVESPTPDVARCAWLSQGADSQGVVGWVIQLPAHQGAGDHNYSLETDSLGYRSLGVTFYADLGTCSSMPPRLGEGLLIPPGTAGIIPAGARYVVIGRWQAWAGPCGCYKLPPVNGEADAAVAATFVFKIWT